MVECEDVEGVLVISKPLGRVRSFESAFDRPVPDDLITIERQVMRWWQIYNMQR